DDRVYPEEVVLFWRRLLLDVRRGDADPDAARDRFICVRHSHDPRCGRATSSIGTCSTSPFPRWECAECAWRALQPTGMDIRRNSMASDKPVNKMRQSSRPGTRRGSRCREAPYPV